MARGRIISRALVAIGTFLVGLLWLPPVQSQQLHHRQPEDDKYQVVVTTPDGKPAKEAVICLDYDPVTDYEPAKFRTEEDGKVSIPHRYAEAAGWHELWAEYKTDGKVFYLRIGRSDVQWPQKMKLTPSKP